MKKFGVAILVVVIVLVLLRTIDRIDDANKADDTGPRTSQSETTSPPAGRDETAIGDDSDKTVDGAGAPNSVSSAPIGGVLYNSNATGTYEIYRLNADGSTTQLTNDSSTDAWWARPSPDGTQMLFYRSPAGVRDTDYGQVSMWIAAADGSDAFEAIPVGAYDWSLHGHGEWSPDGSQIVMFGGDRLNPQIFVTDATGQNPRQVTQEGGVNLDPSWSPDGSTIVYIGCPDSVCFEGDQEVYTVPAAGGDRVQLTEDDLRDNDPYFSPDGGTIVFLTQTEGFSPQAIAGLWDIRLMPSGGGEPFVLTDGEAVTSLPRWTPDGSAILTHRLEYGAQTGFDLISIDPNSGEYTMVLQTDADEEYPSP